MIFSEELKKRAEFAEDVLKSYLPEETGYAVRVAEAMNYSALSGGKHLRPVIMQASYQMFGGRGHVVEPFMAALEMIHNYSLVHDDLPAMDNDLYRRGRKTTHAVYGPGMATLAGDGLLNLAYETALKAFAVGLEDIKAGLSSPAELTEEGTLQTLMESITKALSILADKAGINGMLGGQSADVDAEERNRSVDLEELLYIHEKKTACLLESALMIGGVLCSVGDDDLKRLEKIGHYVGVAFQIEDDILDVTGDEKILGKHVGSDEENGKVTYVTLKGLDQAAKDAAEMTDRALAILDELPASDGFLRELIISLVTRQK
ncbi:geranylgeranyl diphosphate synthase, type II [Lachnospiraceae bacterium]|nr:geranylgeranyl diphosphate synthase, type II [Lachnospiraceae bacterium]